MERIMKTGKWIAITIAILLAIAFVVLYQPDLSREEVDTKYRNHASKFLVLNNGNRIHYRDQGSPDGKTIMLLHGFTSSLHTWEPWVDLLKDTFRIVTLDLPGHGLTGAVENQDYSTTSFSETILGVADALSIDSFVLGGNSMGGGATWQFALAYPERITHMILINATGPWPRQDDRKTKNQNSPFAALEWQWFRRLARHINPRYLVERGLLKAYNNAPVVDRKLVDRYLEMILREGTRDAILKQSAKRRTHVGSTPPSLDVLTQPTLVMWGAMDSLIPVSVGERFVGELPNAELVVYPHLGHVPMEEDASKSVKDIIRFLSLT
ncbi:MAG: alpha/beta hydrolase [Gammaproteobacteria bacterium]|nr:alpha/beta hydrolase [Gammaproteobacteria bacterium]